MHLLSARSIRFGWHIIHIRPDIRGDYDFWQYSSQTTVDGIPGSVDGDFWYEDADNYEVTLDNYTAPQCMVSRRGIFC